MTRSVKQQTPWWASYKKQLLIWVPIAGVQAATLAGVGYFNQQKTANLELAKEVHASPNINSQVVRIESTQPSLSLADAPPTMRVASNNYIPSNSSDTLPTSVMNVPTNVVIKTTVINESPIRSKGVVTTVSAVEQPVSSKPVKAVSAPQHVTKMAEPKATATPVVENKHQEVAAEPAPVAKSKVTAVKAEPAFTEAKPANKEAEESAAVSGIQWIYVGQLRDYGWYGQMLHFSPSSGLPQVGQVYRTQHIHGYYESPKGKRHMGGFQLGDKVLIQDVQQFDNGDVWAKVVKQ